jgi:hypothetical protein
MKKKKKTQLFTEDTNVTPIIRTHNILTSHNPTHNNPPQTHKKSSIIMGSSPSK